MDTHTWFTSVDLKYHEVARHISRDVYSSLVLHVPFYTCESACPETELLANIQTSALPTGADHKHGKDQEDVKEAAAAIGKEIMECASSLFDRMSSTYLKYGTLF